MCGIVHLGHDVSVYVKTLSSGNICYVVNMYDYHYQSKFCVHIVPSA